MTTPNTTETAAKWYAVQTATGRENKVKGLIQTKIDADPRPPEERPIRQALIPTEEAIEIKNGEKVTVDRKIYPGYVIVEMAMGEEALHVISGIQGVIKFAGHDRFPQPLRREEVSRMLGITDPQEAKSPKEESPFVTGQAVSITEGPFADFNGTIEEVLLDKSKVRVSVSLFGRPTSVEMDYQQIRAY